LNNLVGVPAVAFGVTSMDRWCVIEAGMSVRGEIAAISDIVEPEVALVLNATLAHAGGVGGQRADVAREKGALFAGLSPSGIAVANADDRAVMGQLARTVARDIRTFGERKDAVYQLVSRTPRTDGKVGSIVEIATHAGIAVLNLPIPGAAAAIDLVAAWAAAEATLGTHIWAENVQAALDSLAAIDGRMRVERFKNGPIVIDDTYNANPASMANAIDTLREMAVDLRRRAVVVIGEMRELGDVTVEEHRRVGERLAAAGVALVIGCGGATEETLRAFNELAPNADAVSNPDAEAAARAVCERAKPDDVILVKGSRGAKTEQAVEALRLKFAQSAHL
jgi:UDP-N-acetylmuramoyl-tripeptide--D-alanyl-D-alanine ligase